LPEYCNVLGHVDTEIDFNLSADTVERQVLLWRSGGLDGLMPDPVD